MLAISSRGDAFQKLVAMFALGQCRLRRVGVGEQRDSGLGNGPRWPGICWSNFGRAGGHRLILLTGNACVQVAFVSEKMDRFPYGL